MYVPNNHTPKPRDMDHAFKDADMDQSGVIDLPEFLMLYGKSL